MTYATFSYELRSARVSRFGSKFVWVVLGLGLATVGGAVGVRLLTSVLSPPRTARNPESNEIRALLEVLR